MHNITGTIYCVAAILMVPVHQINANYSVFITPFKIKTIRQT